MQHLSIGSLLFRASLGLGIGFGLMVACGCNSQLATVGPKRAAPSTLASNRMLPVSDIERFYSPSQWKKLENLQYVGYVLFKGNIFDEKLSALRAIDSFPDHSYDQMARELLEQVRLKPAEVGTHMTPTAAACVVFYPKEVDGSLALIYARQVGYDDTADVKIARFFRAQRYSKD